MLDIGLRTGRQPVKLIGVNAPFEPAVQLGFLHHSEAHSVRGQHAPHRVPTARTSEQPAINQPLPRREQTILSYQLSPELRRALTSGFTNITNAGRTAPHTQRFGHEVKLGRPQPRSSKPTFVTPVPTTDGRMALRAVHGAIR